MPKIINLHLENWQLAVETADEQEREDNPINNLDFTKLDEMVERWEREGLIPTTTNN